MRFTAKHSPQTLLLRAVFLFVTSLSTVAMAGVEVVSSVTSPKDMTAHKVSAEAALVLDSLHKAASEADWNRYFSLYLPDAIFIGTDANEHWTMEEFQQYARPTQGWTYTLKSRKLNTMQKLNKVIVFDELLDSQSYGVSRGTGTLVLTDMGWKVAQYHLSFPIPNEIAKEITATIKLQ
ncbi:nuclear transport factor 2 family protein [Shewanella nanhaiensis]|uniref:nuclear transport factor 2 family protein n=1 Tax=Shewanella nanhaiensis TaxID=2864872 RepID=UPI001E5C5A5B|nr:nuclear transport factor 2 family protein [Shewanella nanhaiensis]